MSQEQEMEQLRAENTNLRASVQRKDEQIEQLHQSNTELRESVKQAIIAIEYLQERVKALEERHAKDSHNSSLPPSLDRFVRPPKSLRRPSGKKAGGQKISSKLLAGVRSILRSWVASMIARARICVESCSTEAA